MRELYACQLLLTGHEESPGDTLNRAERLIREWVSRPTHLAPELLNEGQHEASGGHTVAVSRYAPAEGDSSGWSCLWHFPGTDDPSVRWTLSLALASQGEGACATVRIGLQQRSHSFQLRRPNYQFSAPAIVRTLLREFEASDAGRPTKPTHETLYAGDIPEFVEWLTNDQRALPVVIATNYPSTGQPLVDLRKLARELSGLAHVVHLSTHLAARALTDRVGAERSAWQGAVRLYWPKFKADANPYEHKYWIPNRLLEDDEALIDELRRWLGSVSAASVPENPALGWMRAARRKALAESGDIPDWVQEYIETTDAELRGLREERDDLKEDLAAAMTDVAAMREQYALVSQYSTKPAAEDGQSAAPSDADASVLSVAEAYQRAKAEIGENLVFLPSADASIKKFSEYKDPEKLHRALSDVADAGRRWGDGTLGKPFGEFFTDLGYGYSAKNPAVRDRRHKRHYEVKYKDNLVVMEPHLKVDESTGPDQCLRIYWYLDESDKVIVIGHVGRHLPD
ncbi:hypothetical protein [Streptomyces rubiginosohelvolus]|uniref:hypothetical protein n=1 Tax=Streptomyces rubiginosohelvolus TaxID=67362 RepID=UPI0036B51C59